AGSSAARRIVVGWPRAGRDIGRKACEPAPRAARSRALSGNRPASRRIPAGPRMVFPVAPAGRDRAVIGQALALPTPDRNEPAKRRAPALAATAIAAMR